ncbi:MAG: DUF3179 domain-containing protein [Rubellimicrobium sp.]|nr:DUF3179 domain-containing protein [Rubellimicrobium sp.]
MRHLIALCLAAVLATPALADPAAWAREWPVTDFTRTTIPDWSEVISGGPPRDGIPAIDAPVFLPVAEEGRLADIEPVMTLEITGEAPRAYPIRYLMWHEIVNDTVGGIPVAVTFCPLCNSGVTFDRRLDGAVLSFGVSGKLRHSDMVMYDRETESWWQQATGEGVVGVHSGTPLTKLPGFMESWAQFRDRNPGGLVMDQPAGFTRDYGRNPYVGYDSSARPFLFSGEMPPHGIDPLARVVRVGERAWPLERLATAGEIGEAGVNLSWAAGQASALDTARIAEGRDVGSVRVRDGAGQDLVHDVMFAFAFHAFWPDGEWMLGE